MQEFPSTLLEQAVDEFAKLPGIGRKTALRLMLHLLKQKPEEVQRFAETIDTARKNIKYCQNCHNISDQDICPICADSHRDRQTICVVENVQDVMAVENTQQYYGTYHVLGGLISPMDGIGPSDLRIESLLRRVSEQQIKEVILALSSTMEGDTTNFYISKKLQGKSITISTISKGIAVGDEIEYADEVTLGRSILNRININE